jgi:hypothetical protein
MILGISIGFSMNASGQTTPIPNWLKNTALWWGQGQISDSEFIKAIQWLVDQKIIVLPNNQQSSSSNTSISSPSNVNQSESSSVAVYPVNSTAVFNGVSYTINGVDRGYSRIIFTITDLGNYPIELPEDPFVLIDSNGRTYTESKDLIFASSIDLQPGVPFQMTRVFQLKYDSSLTYYFGVLADPSDIKSVKVKISLGVPK